MTVGIALSGGGVVAFTASTCINMWLNEAFPGLFQAGSGVELSTCSGGTLGTALFMNAGGRMEVPRFNPAMSYEEACNHHPSDGKYWFGMGSQLRRRSDDQEHEELRRRFREYDGLNEVPQGDVPKGDLGAHAWESVVKYEMHRYGVREIQGSDIPWYANFGYVLKPEAPLKVNGRGYMANPIGKFGMGFREMHSGRNFPRDEIVDNLDAVAWSSAFWSGLPLFQDPTKARSANRLKWAMQKNQLPQDDRYYFSDAGIVDGTGITNLLAKGVDSIVAFFDVPDMDKHLTQMQQLFGVGFGPAGPGAYQVFPSAVMGSVMKNLTDPKILRARLTDVPVLQNNWLGVRPYTLKTLIILSDLYTDEFVDTFHDPRIKENLSTKFQTLSYKTMGPIPTLDANMFCMFEQWKGEKYKDEIADVLYANGFNHRG